MSEILHSSSRSGRSVLSPTLFGRLAPEARASLRQAASLRNFAKGGLIQQRGDSIDGFWLIEEGQVAVGQFLDDGAFRAVALLGPGDSYGELALLSRQRRVADAVARSPCKMRWIDGPSFEATLAKDPASARAVLGAMAEELQELIVLLVNIRRGTARERIARYLARLAEAGPDISISQEELAELAGVTRATVNSALRNLEVCGAIARGYRRITVIDRALLLATSD